MTPEQRREARSLGIARRATRPLKQSATLSVIIAALARGWTLDQVAFASGSSRQNIYDRIRGYESKHGTTVSRDRNQRPTRTAKRLWHCSYCGKSEWALVGKKPFNDAFCSQICSAKFARRVPDDIVEKAIDMRWAGHSWTSISLVVGHNIQTIQARIWKHLYQINSLDMETVTSIWQRGRWRWIERCTGLIAAETGARLTDPSYGRKGEAWGRRIVRRKPSDKY